MIKLELASCQLPGSLKLRGGQRSNGREPHKTATELHHQRPGCQSLWQRRQCRALAQRKAILLEVLDDVTWVADSQKALNDADGRRGRGHPGPGQARVDLHNFPGSILRVRRLVLLDSVYEVPQQGSCQGRRTAESGLSDDPGLGRPLPGQAPKQTVAATSRASRGSYRTLHIAAPKRSRSCGTSSRWALPWLASRLSCFCFRCRCCLRSCPSIGWLQGLRRRRFLDTTEPARGMSEP